MFGPLFTSSFSISRATPGHRGDGLDRVEPVGRFTAQHHGVHPLIDRIGHVADFGPGRPRMLDHRMKHLRGDDDGLFALDALLDEQPLRDRNPLGRNLDAQIAPGDHDTVRLVEYLVDIVYAFAVLDFRDDLDRAVAVLEYLLDGQNVRLFPDERVGDEVDIHVDRPIDELVVLVRHRGKVDRYAGNVHALAGFDYAAVMHLADQLVIGFVDHLQFEFAVVYQDDRSGRNRIVYRRVVQIYRLIARRTVFGRALHPDKLSLFDGNAALEAGGHAGQADFGSFGVDDDSDLLGDAADVFDDRRRTAGRDVSRVDAHGVHAGLVQGADELYLAALVRDRGDYFGSFIHSFRFPFVCSGRAGGRRRFIP